MKAVIPALILLVGGNLVGCNAKDASELQRDVGQVAKTATRAAGNAQVVARVNAALLQRKGVDMSGLRVENTGGVVTVSGRVRTAEERRIVMETVKGIRGVDKAIDKLRVAAK